MSSLFLHQAEADYTSSNRFYLIKNKNSSKQKKIYLNVKNFKSPTSKSVSKRKNSAIKLFKQAHKLSSVSTQETFLSPQAKSNTKIESTKSIHSREQQKLKLKDSLKTKRVNTMEQKRPKITLKKTLSQGNNIQNILQVCINGEKIKQAKADDIMSDLTRMILTQNQDNKQEISQHDWSTLFEESIFDDNSFELQIDSNLIQNSKNALEWQELIKRI